MGAGLGALDGEDTESSAMSEDEPDQLVHVDAGVSSEGARLGLTVSKEFPGVLGRILPVRWTANRQATRVICDGIVGKLSQGEELTAAERAFVDEEMDSRIGNFFRRRRIELRAAEIVDERLSAGEEPMPGGYEGEALLPENAFEQPESTSQKQTAPDWEYKLRDDAGHVDDEMIRELYSQILAEESMRPGAISLRTLGVLRYLDRETAETFLKAVSILINRYLIPGGEDDEGVQEAAGLRHIDLLNLTDAGLINAGYSATPRSTKVSWKVTLSGQLQAVIIRREDDQEFALRLSGHVLTPAGLQLSRLVPITPSDGVSNALLKSLRERSPAEATIWLAKIPSRRWNGKGSELSWDEWREG